MASGSRDFEECSPSNCTGRSLIFSFFLLCSVAYVVLASVTASNFADVKVYVTDKNTITQLPQFSSPSPSPTASNENANAIPDLEQMVESKVEWSVLPKNSNEPDDADDIERLDFKGFKVTLSFSIIAVLAALSCSYIMLLTDWGDNGGREIMEGMSLMAYGYSAAFMAVVGTLLMSCDEIVNLDSKQSTYTLYNATWIAAYVMMSFYGFLLGYYFWQRFDDEDVTGYNKRRPPNR